MFRLLAVTFRAENCRWEV